MKELKSKLENYLGDLQKQVGSKSRIILDKTLKLPAALCNLTQGLLLCADDGLKTVVEISLEFNGVSVAGNVSDVFLYPEGISCISSMAYLSGDIYLIGNSPNHSTLMKCSVESRFIVAVFEDNECQSGFSRICIQDNHIIVTDAESRQVKKITDDGIEVVAGNGSNARKDGTGHSSAFRQPLGVCAEGKTVYITDATAGCVIMRTPMCGTVQFLRALGSIYSVFDVHCKGESVANVALKQAADCLREVDRGVESISGD